MSTRRKINSAPTGEFTVKQLASQNSVSYVTAHQFVKKNEVSGTIRFVRTEKVTAGKGKKANIYQVVGELFAPAAPVPETVTNDSTESV